MGARNPRLRRTHLDAHHPGGCPRDPLPGQRHPALSRTVQRTLGGLPLPGSSAQLLLRPPRTAGSLAHPRPGLRRRPVPRDQGRRPHRSLLRAHPGSRNDRNPRARDRRELSGRGGQPRCSPHSHSLPHPGGRRRAPRRRTQLRPRRTRPASPARRALPPRHGLRSGRARSRRLRLREEAPA